MNLYDMTAVDFFNQINMLYGTITEFCSKEECPVMTAGPRWVYCTSCLPPISSMQGPSCAQQGNPAASQPS